MNTKTGIQVHPHHLRPRSTGLQVGEGAIRAFHGTVAGLLTVTLIAQSALTRSEGRSLLNTFSYFTIQSNILVLVASTILVLNPDVDGRWWRIVRLGSLTGITVTGLVYATILAPYVHLHGWALVYNYIFHYVVPIASVIGFFVVGPRVSLQRRDLAFMGWPVLWLIYTMLRGAILRPDFTGFVQPPSHYPYPFLDVDRTPLFEVVLSIVFVTLLLVGIALIYIVSERRLEGRNRA